MLWTFEPGHTAATFRARHMMVTWVRGHFRDIHGTLDFDPARCRLVACRAEIEAAHVWTGEANRDAHLRGSDFLDVERYPSIVFESTGAEQVGQSDFKLNGNLTLRGVTRAVLLDVHYLGQWDTPWWEDGVDRGPKKRAGFHAEARIDRRDYGISWNGALENGGIVVSNDVFITLDAEAIAD